MFPEHMTLDQHCEGDLFDLILTFHQQSFSYVGTGLPGLNFSNTRLDPLENLKGKPEFNVGPLIRPLAKRH